MEGQCEVITDYTDKSDLMVLCVRFRDNILFNLAVYARISVDQDYCSRNKIVVNMNKRLVLLSCFLLVSVAAYAQYPYKWQIGGTMGMGGTIYTDGGDPTMSMTIGFNKAVQNTKWRWCIEAGIMNQGIVDYFFEDDAPDIFVRPNFEYVGVIADYSLFSKGEGFNIFARGGFAPAHQRDLYVYHSEDRFTALGLIGVGADYYWSKVMITGYISTSGIVTIQVSYGWWFGKRCK